MNRKHKAGRVVTPQSANRRSGAARSYWTLGFSLAVLPLLARAERRYRQMPQLPLREPAKLPLSEPAELPVSEPVELIAESPVREPAEPLNSEPVELPVSEPVELPPLSIIVPARNEEQNLRRLLPSLLGQEYAGEIEIIVVDDHSTDGTARVVESEMETANNQRKKGQERLRLIRAEALPEGWLGKPHASHLGAGAARGEWLLFTDADTVHEAASAASAVAFAGARGLDGLSLFPQQETRGLMDSAVLMVAFAGLFAALPRSTTMLNGQYVLLRREVYEASGGFAAVCSEMLEDLAYGRLLAEQGYRAPIMRAESLVSVHMYEDWRQMWYGVTRLGSGSLRFNGLLALIPAIFITGLMMPLWTMLFNRRYIRDIPRLRLIWLAAMVAFFPWASRFNKEQKTENGKRKTALRALLAPAAALFVQVSALWGMVSRLLGWGVSWKDRKV